MNIEHLKNSKCNDLFKAILSLNNVDECYMFFSDLCTPNELKKLSERLEIARKLNTGTTFTSVCMNVKASSATIAKVKHNLIYGNDGYDLVLNKKGITYDSQIK